MADMRDRLIELLCAGTLKTEICTTETHLECESCRGDCGYCTILADHLLANGVMLPPCKVGDTVWEINTDNPFEEDLRVMESKVECILIGTTHDLYRMDSKWLFLTREEAEKALGEKENEP